MFPLHAHSPLPDPQTARPARMPHRPASRLEVQRHRLDDERRAHHAVDGAVPARTPVRRQNRGLWIVESLRDGLGALLPAAGERITSARANMAPDASNQAHHA